MALTVGRVPDSGGAASEYHDSPSALRARLESAGLRPSRARGQNFLADPALADRIARLSALRAGSAVLEIGAGLGGLTAALARTGSHVVALEVDRGLIPLLRARVEPLGVQVIEADALVADLGGIVAQADDRLGGVPWSVVANLPYNIATPLVLRLLEEVPAAHRMLVMLQAEVAERMAASVGDSAYGAVSVRVSYFAKAKVVTKVPPQVFIPRPRVSSALLRLERHEVLGCAAEAEPFPGARYPRLVELVRAGFGQRRKTLRHSLSNVVPPGAMEACGISPGQRAEELNLEQWCRLAGFGGAE